jgi:hypothetical protein
MSGGSLWWYCMVTEMQTTEFGVFGKQMISAEHRPCPTLFLLTATMLDIGRHGLGHGSLGSAEVGRDVMETNVSSEKSTSCLSRKKVPVTACWSCHPIWLTRQDLNQGWSWD